MAFASHTNAFSHMSPAHHTHTVQFQQKKKEKRIVSLLFMKKYFSSLKSAYVRLVAIQCKVFKRNLIQNKSIYLYIHEITPAFW